MSRKAGTLPHQTPVLGQELGHFPAHQLVRHRLLAVRVEFVGIRHLPRAARVAVVVAHAGAHGLQLGLLRVEGVAVEVLGAARLALMQRLLSV